VAADLARSRQYSSAREVYRRGVADTPSDGRLWLGWARMEARAPVALGGGRPAARSVYTAALAACPDNAYLLHAAGVFESSAGRYPRARELLARALAAAPSDVLVYQAAALVEERSGNTARARELFAAGGQVDGGSAHLFSAWGAMEARCDYPGAAAGLYERAVECDPSHARSWQGWAIATARSGDVDKAATLFETAVALRPSAPTYQAWGLAEAGRGDVDRARELFGLALDVGGGVAIYHAWGRMEEGLGDYDRARELYDAGVRDDPGGVACISAWAIMEAKLGHISKDDEWMVPRPDEGDMARKRRNERLRAQREGLKILEGDGAAARRGGRKRASMASTSRQGGAPSGQRDGAAAGGDRAASTAQHTASGDAHHHLDQRHHRRDDHDEHHHHVSDASRLVLPVSHAATSAGAAAGDHTGAQATSGSQPGTPSGAETRMSYASDTDDSVEAYVLSRPEATARPAASASTAASTAPASAAPAPAVRRADEDHATQLSNISTNLRMLKKLVGQRTDEDTRTLLAWLDSRAQADASLFTRLSQRGEADAQKLMQWAARRSANDVNAFSDWVARRYEEDRRIGVYVFGLDIPRSARKPATAPVKVGAAVVEKPVEWLRLQEAPSRMTLAEFDERLYTEETTREAVWVMVWLGNLAESLANRAALTSALAGISLLVVAASLHLMAVTEVPERPPQEAVRPAEGVDAKLIQQRFE